MVVKVDGKYTSFRDVHVLNAYVPTVVTPSGIIIFVSAVQFEKAKPNIVFNFPLLKNVTFSRFLQAENAFASILSTFSGIVTSFNKVQSAKAFDPIEVTLAGIVILCRILK